MSKERDTNRDQLLLFGELVPIGGGAFKVVHQKPFSSELTPRQAARFLGISRPGIYRLLEETKLLTHRRPSPGKILITLESLTRHREESKDPEFWERQRNPSQPSLLSQPS